MILGGVHTCIHTCRSISVNIDKKREDKCQCIHVDVGESLTVLTKPKKACREDAIERDPATKLQVVLQKLARWFRTDSSCKTYSCIGYL